MIRMMMMMMIDYDVPVHYGIVIGLDSEMVIIADTCDGAGVSSSLEKVFFGTFHARMYLNR